MKHFITIVDGVPRNEYVQRPDQRAKRREYQQTHKEEHRKYYRNYREKYPNRALYHAAKSRAKRKGLEFTIEYEDIVIPEICPILHTPIICSAGHGTPGGKMSSPSIDRIDNDKGYIKGNVQVISHKANSMKFNASKEELLKFAAWIGVTYG